MRCQAKGCRLEVQADFAGTMVTAELEIRPGEQKEELRGRARGALLEMLGHADHEDRERRTRQCGAWLEGWQFETERPWGPIFTQLELDGRVVRGQAAEPDQKYLLRARQPDGEEREFLLHGDRFGRFSVDLGELKAVSLTPVSGDGVHGTEVAL